jgi:translation initiation factor IF-1
MSDQSNLIIEGTVVENLPNTMFRVKIDYSGNSPELLGQLILCTIAGRMRLHYVRLLPGDKVRCEISPLDKTRGRVVYKLK